MNMHQQVKMREDIRGLVAPKHGFVLRYLWLVRRGTQELGGQLVIQMIVVHNSYLEGLFECRVQPTKIYGYYTLPLRINYPQTYLAVEMSLLMDTRRRSFLSITWAVCGRKLKYIYRVESYDHYSIMQESMINGEVSLVEPVLWQC